MKYAIQVAAGPELDTTSGTLAAGQYWVGHPESKSFSWGAFV